MAVNPFARMWGEATRLPAPRAAVQPVRPGGGGGLRGLALALMSVGRQWTGELRPTVEIDLSPWALPRYALYSLSRGLIAYVFSFLFTLGYGYWAAKDALAERALVPLLDILQSIPVLGFMPGLVLALVALFPHSQHGPGDGRGGDDLHRPGLEHDLQPLPLAEVVPPRSSARWPRLPLQLVATLQVGGTPLRHHRPGLEQHDEHGRRLVLPDDQRSLRVGDKDFRLPGLGSYMSVAVARGDSDRHVRAQAGQAEVLVAQLERLGDGERKNQLPAMLIMEFQIKNQWPKREFSSFTALVNQLKR